MCLCICFDSWMSIALWANVVCCFNPTVNKAYLILFFFLSYRNRRFWGSIRHPLLKQNAIPFSLYKLKYPFSESEINCIKYFSMYVVFFITSNLEQIFQYSSRVYMDENPNENRQIHINFYPFSKFRRYMPEKLPIFSWFLAFLWKKIPPFAKMARSMYLRFGRNWVAGTWRST